MKVLSCIPEQKITKREKLAWIRKQLKAHHPDLLVTPQEFFGGIQAFWHDQPISYQPEEIIEPITKLAKEFDCAIATGAVIDDPELEERRERIYIIDGSDWVSFYDKMFLPAYDHIEAKSPLAIHPERSFKKRAHIAEVKGARISVIFCWEIFSNYLWHTISRAQPDFVLSMIKFGACGWPKKKAGDSIFEQQFGFGADGGWIDRLRMAARFDVAAPIVCSTNSWNLPARSRPLCGVINHFDPEHETFWHPPKGTRGEIEERIDIAEVDHLFSRFVRANKHTLKSETDRWPTNEAHQATMMWKIKRMERKVIREAEEKADNPQFDLI